MNLLPPVTVSYVALAVAVVANMAIGYIWYGPLFGKTWIKLTGIKEMGNKDDMPKSYAIQAVGSLVTAYVLSVFLSLTNSTTLETALPVALWAWLGFQATLGLGSVLWEGKSWNLYFLNGAYQLINLLVVAAILTYIK